MRNIKNIKNTKRGKTIPEQVDAIINNPLIDFTAPSAILLRVQLSRRTLNEKAVLNAQDNLVDAARTGEPAGVLKRLQEQIVYHEKMLLESEKRVLNTATELLNSKTAAATIAEPALDFVPFLILKD